MTVNASADHREAASAFLRLIAAGRVREAYKKYVGPSFRHHNPSFRGDMDSLRAGMEADAAVLPDKILEIQRSLGEGDLVAIHSWLRPQPEDRGMALVHLFRFEGDRIAEVWDVVQEVPEDSPNEHGMF